MLHARKDPRKLQQKKSAESLASPEGTQKRVPLTFYVIQDEYNVQLSRRTIGRRLVESGLHDRTAARKKPLLPKIQRKQRLDFANSH